MTEAERLETLFQLGQLPEQREKYTRRRWCPKCRTKLGRPKTEYGVLLQSSCETCNHAGTVDGSVVVGAS